ncbi:MAG TPA: copper resistance CopC family protein, partial [Actinomycetales bacterium]|nr:copper resistance CopC family protein [Actinomycetales bacterium]
MKSLINAVVVGLLVLGVGLLGAVPASAHNVLRSSTPADGAVVATPPADVQLTFDQSVVTLGTEVAVTGPAGALTLDAPEVDGDTVTQPLPA